MSQEILHRVRGCMDRGWRWMVSDLSRFLPSDSISPDSMKQIGELALLYAQTVQWFGSAPALEVQRTGDFITDYFSRADVIQLARKRPGSYTAYLVPYLALRASGRRIEGFEETLVVLDRAGYPHASEILPFRGLEIQHALWKSGVNHGSRPSRAEYRTTLELCPNPAYLILWEVYSITHTLFYETDFSGPAAHLSVADSSRATTLSRTLLVHYWRKQDWDLVGELLLNLLALDQIGDGLFTGALQALLDAWRPDGVLPGPNLTSVTGVPSEKLIFEHCYHTTLVGLLLCGAYIYRLDLNEGARPHVSA